MLDGLEATTHDGAVDLLREVAPKSAVHANCRFVDNDRWENRPIPVKMDKNNRRENGPGDITPLLASGRSQPMPTNLAVVLMFVHDLVMEGQGEGDAK